MAVIPRRTAQAQRDYRRRLKEKMEYGQLCARDIMRLAQAAHIAQASGKIELPPHMPFDDLDTVRALIDYLTEQKEKPIKKR